MLFDDWSRRTIMALLYSDLRKYDFFSSLSDDTLESLCERIKIVSFPAGSEIVKEGMVGESFYFVKQGTLEIIKNTKSGLSTKLAVIGSGQDFGEMALLTCSVRSSSVWAITDVILYELPKADFEDIVLHDSARNISTGIVQ